VASATRIGRYVLYDAIAAGGMASVHLGRLVGPVGFSRTVAIKRLHPHLALDQDFVAMFLDEARLAARIQHPNVVATVDVVSDGGELFLVMDYIQGDSLSHLVKQSSKTGQPVPPRIAAAVVTGALHGLHAAHEATSERGEAMSIVHRDVSPQNILVGVDGLPRVVDFGVAKAVSRAQTTQDGQVKGKLAYMAPEQLERRSVDRRADLYAMGVVLWEVLAGKRLFEALDAPAVIAAVLDNQIPELSNIRSDVPRALDDVLRKTLHRDPSARYATRRSATSRRG
jgi:serine/threonine-protein kinase